MLIEIAEHEYDASARLLLEASLGAFGDVTGSFRCARADESVWG